MQALWLFETDGAFLPVSEQTPEAVLGAWDEVCDISNQSELDSGFKQSEKFLNKAVAHIQNNQ